MDKVYRKNPYPQLQYIEFPVWQVLSGKKQFLLFSYVYGKLVTSDKTHVINIKVNITGNEIQERERWKK